MTSTTATYDLHVFSRRILPGSRYFRACLSGLSSPGTGQIITRFNDGLTIPYELVFWVPLK